MQIINIQFILCIISGGPIQRDVLCQGEELHLETDRGPRQLHWVQGVGHHELLVPADLHHHVDTLHCARVPGNNVVLLL